VACQLGRPRSRQGTSPADAQCARTSRARAHMPPPADGRGRAAAQGGPTALQLGTAPLVPLGNGSAAGAAVEAALPAGLFAVRAYFLGGVGAAPSYSPPANVSSGLVRGGGAAVSPCARLRTASLLTRLGAQTLPSLGEQEAFFGKHLRCVVGQLVHRTAAQRHRSLVPHVNDDARWRVPPPPRAPAPRPTAAPPRADAGARDLGARCADGHAAQGGRARVGAVRG